MAKAAHDLTLISFCQSGTVAAAFRVGGLPGSQFRASMAVKDLGKHPVVSELWDSQGPHLAAKRFGQGPKAA